VDLTPHGGFVISGFSCSFGNGSDIYLIKTDRDGIEEWSDLFGGSLEDEGRAGQQTADGGYVVAGFDREGAGMSYASVIKLQAEDRRIWSRTYGVSSRDEAFSVQQTLDSGYIMAGWTWSDALNTPDAFLVKTDQAGNTVWARRFGGSGWDGARSLLGVEDGYVFSGVTDPGEGTFYDAWLVKTDFSGTQVWSQTYDAGAYEWADCVSRTWDGGFVLAGRTGPLGPDPLSDLDVYWVRTNSKGEHIWIRSISGPGDEWASCVQQTLDGGFILAGATNSWGNRGYEVFLLKTTSAGFIQGQQTFGGTEDDYGRAVLQTSSGGFIVAGSTTSLGAGGSDIYLIKTDPWLNLLWQKTFGGPDDEEAFSLVQTSNGNFAVCGWSESFGPGDRNAIVVEFDGNGDPIWSGIFGGMKDDWVRSLVQTRDRGYAAAGGTTSFGVTGTDCYLLKLAPDESYPIVDIRANGLDGPMEIKAGDWLEVSLTLEPNDLKGEVADWWVVADTAAGWYFYDPFRGWVPGVGVTFNGALFELNRFAVFRTNTLPPDLYRFYFGFDTVPDGRPDPGSPYRDVVGVVVTP
jgi:hypothetical protein